MSSELNALQAERRIQSEEELLALQRQFQEGHLTPSTKVFRGVRKSNAAAPSTATATTSTTAPSTPAPISLTGSYAFKSSTESSSSTSTTSSTTSGPIREIEPISSGDLSNVVSAISEHAVAAPRSTFTQSSVAAARTGFPAAFKANLNANTTATSTTLSTRPAPTTSQPPEKKKSLFAQQRDRMLQKQREEAASLATNAATPVKESTTSPTPTAAAISREVVQLSTAHQPVAATSAASSSSSIGGTGATRSVIPMDVPESKGINEENTLRLASMSVDEIEEEQRELEKSLPPALVAMLRARRAGGATSSTPSSTNPLRPPIVPTREYPMPEQLDEDLLDDAELDSESSDEEAMDENGFIVVKARDRLEQDAALDQYSAKLAATSEQQAAQKLEWTEPIQPTAPITWPSDLQGYQNDSEVWNSFRVDLEGRFIGTQLMKRLKTEQKSDGSIHADTATSDVDYDDPSNALYHHGDQADRPGYTMREILHLVRSTVMSQRTLALQTMAKVLMRIRENEFEYPATVQPTPYGNRKASTIGEPINNTIPPFAHLLFSHLLYLNLCTLLRLALDDNRNAAGILAALHCFQTMVFLPRINIQMVLDQQMLWRGHHLERRYEELPSLVGEMTPKSAPASAGKKNQPPAEQEQEDETGTRPEERDGQQEAVNDNAKDEELCAKDLIVGLTRMQLLERLRFILETFILPAVQHRANPPTESSLKKLNLPPVNISDATASLVMLSPVISILLAFVQHSPQAASTVFERPRLKETLVKIVQGLITIVASGNNEPKSLSLSSLSASLHSSLLLIGNLSQIHRDIAYYFLKSTIFDRLKKFIVLPNGVPGLDQTHSQLSHDELKILIPISIQTLHLWRICLSYGLDIEAFMDHYPVLLGIVDQTKTRIEQVTNGPSHVHQLWLRQLRHVCSVIEGLVLLFQPFDSSAREAMETFSAPPTALSFEFAHIVHAVDQVLSALPHIFFAKIDGFATDLRLAMQETLAQFLHLVGSYYSILVKQHPFEAGRAEVQLQKHLVSLFARSADSPLLAYGKQIISQADSRGLDSIIQLDTQLRPALSFTNITITIPSNSIRLLKQSLNTWFGLIHWCESLVDQLMDREPNLTKTIQQIIQTTYEPRKQLLEHFYATKHQGLNRLHQRQHLLSGLECELIVTLLKLTRQDPPLSDPSLSSSNTSQAVLQLIPSLLRNGQQTHVQRFYQTVLFHTAPHQKSNLSQLKCPQCPLSSNHSLTFGESKMLVDLYTHFSYFPEEFLVSTCLHTSSIVTPTLCVPNATATNVIASLETSTTDRYVVTIPEYSRSNISVTHTSGVWLLNILKHTKFLQVQLATKTGDSKLNRVVTLLKYFHSLDEAFNVFTPQPTSLGAHPAATIFLRSLMELYLLGSDIFLEPAFTQYLTHFLPKLLDGLPNSSLSSHQFIGVPNHATSTLMFGASITAPGNATIRTQGNEMVKLIRPDEEGQPNTDITTSSSSPLAALHPFYDFQSSNVPTSIWGASFYPFFKDLVELFVADSMGDPLFARLILLFLRQEYSTDFRLVIWRECSDLMQSLDAKLPLDELGFLFPYETNTEILGLLINHIGGVPTQLTRERNPALYRIAIHHVAIHLFGWSHVSGTKDMDASERVKRVQELLPMTISPECLKDLHEYRFIASIHMAAAAEMKKDANQQDPSSPSPSPSLSSPSPAPLSASPPTTGAVAPIRSKSGMTPQTLTTEQRTQIDATRAAARARPPIEIIPTGVYGLICPCCTKPNSTSATLCTGCSFEIVPEDLARLPDNIFLQIVNRAPEASDNRIHFRGEVDGREYIIFDDKFGTSDHHLDCITSEVFTDISVLTREHLPILENLFKLGRQVLLDRKLPWLPGDIVIDDYITAGYNFPVSVKHLHLHMVLAPYYHDKIFTVGRWHSHAKVTRDLKEHGRVLIYAHHPNDAEGQAVYDRAIRASRYLQPFKEAWEAKQNA